MWIFVVSFFVEVKAGGVKVGILKLLIFVTVLVFAFIMGVVLMFEFAWWKLLAFIIINVGLGHGVYYLFQLTAKKLGAAFFLAFEMVVCTGVIISKLKNKK